MVSLYLPSSVTRPETPAPDFLPKDGVKRSWMDSEWEDRQREKQFDPEKFRYNKRFDHPVSTYAISNTFSTTRNLLVEFDVECESGVSMNLHTPWWIVDTQGSYQTFVGLFRAFGDRHVFEQLVRSFDDFSNNAFGWPLWHIISIQDWPAFDWDRGPWFENWEVGEWMSYTEHETCRCYQMGIKGMGRCLGRDHPHVVEGVPARRPWWDLRRGEV